MRNSVTSLCDTLKNIVYIHGKEANNKNNNKNKRALKLFFFFFESAFVAGNFFVIATKKQGSLDDV